MDISTAGIYPPPPVEATPTSKEHKALGPLNVAPWILACLVAVGGFVNRHFYKLTHHLSLRFPMPLCIQQHKPRQGRSAGVSELLVLTLPGLQMGWQVKPKQE